MHGINLYKDVCARYDYSGFHFIRKDSNPTRIENRKVKGVEAFVCRQTLTQLPPPTPKKKCVCVLTFDYMHDLDIII